MLECCTLPRCVVAVCGQVFRRSLFCPGFGREGRRGHLALCAAQEDCKAVLVTVRVFAFRL